MESRNRGRHGDSEGLAFRLRASAALLGIYIALSLGVWAALRLLSSLDMAPVDAENGATVAIPVAAPSTLPAADDAAGSDASCEVPLGMRSIPCSRPEHTHEQID